MMIKPSVSLLDPSIAYYVIKEEWWGWGSGDIYDQNGSTIGHMHRRLISIRAFTEVNNLDGSLNFSVERKIVSIRSSYVIKDPQGIVLGRTNRKILTLFRPKLWLENARGKKLLEAQGSFIGKDFKIKDTTNNRLVAHVRKSDFFRDLILGGGILDFTDTYAVKVLDNTYDKRLILGFVIAIDNSVHDKK